MTVQTMLEINNPFDVHTPLGYGVAMFLIAGAYTANPQLLVKLYQNGQLKSFDTNDVLMYGSPTYGEPLKPEIPTAWKQ